MSRFDDILQVPDEMLPQAMPLPPGDPAGMPPDLPGLGDARTPPPGPAPQQSGGEKAGQLVALLGSMQQTLLAILRNTDRMAN